ncbi:MAG: MFS transporter [Planctomycetes bacterium]|nr:MFS transporter [Planctomycetota bacterium]
MASLRSNPRLLCGFHALQMSLFPMAIITIFFKEEIGLDMGEIMLLQGCFGLAMAAFEFPSGYLADRIGYRRSLVLAAIMQVAGWSLYVLAENWLAVVAAELVLGVGMSLVSGSDAALLYESLVDLGQEEDYALWSGRMKFWGQFGEGTAAIAAGLLYAVHGRLPFVIEVGIWLIAVLVALRLVEPSRERPPLGDDWNQVKRLTAELFHGNPRLRSTALAMIVFGMSSFVPVWTIQLYALDAGLREAWLGPVWAAANYSVAIGALLSRPLGRWLGLGRLLVVCVALVAAGYAGLGFSHALFGFAFYFLLTLMCGLYMPMLQHVEQRLIPSRDRAGFLSLRSLLFRSAFLVIGPVVGGAIDRRGQHEVMLVLGAIFTLLAGLALLGLRRRGLLRPSSPSGAA